VPVIRQFRESDTPTVWALNALPNVGATADPTVPVPIPPSSVPPSDFPDLIDVVGNYLLCGGEFLVAEVSGHVVGMGGLQPTAPGQAVLVRLRVHPATRRRGIGRSVVTALEQRARQMGVTALQLTTATNQPEAMAFFRGVGYVQAGRERQTGWSWTLVHFTKSL
jgi:ribosomal protein S18 acetylase RimI-like enzyme